MKNILRIFKNDLISVGKNLIVFIVIIGICILPALYAWFNIAANWDPYSNTDGISFAVCNLDKGYSYSAISINAGDEIVDNLKSNDKMGWTFVSEKEAKEGVDNGTYDAAVIIPAKFSECLFSVTTGKFEQANLQYYINEKKNAIAPKITDKGIEAIEESVNSTYVSTITKYIATALNLTNDSLNKNKDETTANIKKTLETAKKDVDTFKTTVDVFISTLDTISDIISTNKEMLPTIQQKLADAGVLTSNVKTSIMNTQNSALQVSNSLEGIIESVQSFADDLSVQADSAFAEAEAKGASAADKLRNVTAVNDRIISVNNRIITMLTNIQNSLGIDCSPVITKFNEANTRQNDIKNSINSAADVLEKTGKLPAETKAKIQSLINQSKIDTQSVRSSFSGIKTNIDTAINKSYAALDNVYNILMNLSGNVPELNTTFDTASNTVSSLKTTFNGLKTFMDDVKTKIDGFSETIDGILNNDNLINIITPIIENPTALGNFVSSPVTVQKHRIYPIENYGSGMTPFYTSLGFWVGGVILIAVMKTDLTKAELKRLKKPRSTQLYFGRYLIYFLLGQIQAWIIALGDLFFLKVQCADPVLFVAGCLISSFVYTLIIYSLTITFSVIGKALAVIILVIQIAGSGGTFPVEVLPAPFQAVSPYLPFKYGINALREAIAGPDINAYLSNISILLAFTLFALVLGLILRKPCIKIISFFNKRVEQSDIIV